MSSGSPTAVPRLTSNGSNIPITIVLSFQSSLGCVSASLPSPSAQPQPQISRPAEPTLRFRFPSQIKIQRSLFGLRASPRHRTRDIRVIRDFQGFARAGARALSTPHPPVAAVAVAAFCPPRSALLFPPNHLLAHLKTSPRCPSVHHGWHTDPHYGRRPRDAGGSCGRPWYRCVLMASMDPHRTETK